MKQIDIQNTTMPPPDSREKKQTIIIEGCKVTLSFHSQGESGVLNNIRHTLIASGAGKAFNE